MKWYWWVAIGILALNGLVIAMIAVSLAVNGWRRNRAARESRRKESGNPDA